MRKWLFWATNRVVIGLIVFFIAIGFWEFKLKPQYRGYYEQGIAHYHAGRYQEALAELDRAYNIAPNAVDVLMMQGWVNLKLKRYEEARMYFDRVLRIDPRVEEARMGSAFVAIDTGRGEIDYKSISKYLGKRAADPNVAILLAAALVKDGKNLEAAEIYSRLLHNKDYGRASREALTQMLGTDPEEGGIAVQLADKKRPDQLQVRYRAYQRSMWRMQAGNWEPYYITGVDLGPGSPGHYPALPPSDMQSYSDWIMQAERMNANTLRVYTLLPPAFYKAYRQHKQNGGKIELYQQIWIGDPPNKDLYDPKFVDESKAEIRYVVDALHGHGDVPSKHARGSGLYLQDVAADTAAILLGRELEASTAIQTNIVNAGKQRYDGKYISIANATATEVWFAEMLDYLVAYETDTYNWQHPVAIVNWPPMDALYHKTETPNFDEVKFRIRHGEKLELPKNIDDDNDAVSIDEAKYQVKPALYAGMFASYHVYPYYPDFLILDRDYLNTRDSEGPNPMYAYLKELREHISMMPLLITEYGIPNSNGISHFHPYGWHHGGHSEAEQADLLVRQTRTIREAGCAGGIAFSLIDEWYKHNWLTVDFQNPTERGAYWINELDPEKRYGVIGYRTSNWKLFNDPAAWLDQKAIFTATGSGIQAVQVAMDEAFLYVRLRGACTDCATKRNYAVAISTIPAGVGYRQMPFAGAKRVNGGANFLLFLSDPTDSRLFIAANYNPYQIRPREGVPNETELSYKRPFTPTIAEQGEFEELVVETNRRRFGRDGTLYPGQRYSRSVLRYAATDADRADTLPEWYSDPKAKVIVARIPWGKLLMTDPSGKRAFAGFGVTGEMATRASIGVDLSVFELEPTGPKADWKKQRVVAQFLATGENATRLTWKGWESVTPQPYFKKAYYAMQKELLEQSRATNPNHSGGLRAAGSNQSGANAR
jgi:hypothetical protein